MGRAYVVVEGHGEQEAIRNLATKLWADLGLPPVVWAPPIRGTDVKTQAGVLRSCELLRSHGDCDRALLLRDADDTDDCPATSGPETAAWVAAAKLPFPVAVVLARREYEAWFLACLPAIAGREIRPGVAIPAGTVFEGDPEEKRDAKGALTEHYPRGKAYRPSTDQLVLTRMLDFAMLRARNVRAFGTLERALRFLAAPGEASVYPPRRGEARRTELPPGPRKRRAR
jgi:hypothetical protein